MEEVLDHSYWNSRYINNQFGWDVGQITEPLKHYFDQLNNKQISILIPGAGNAYEAQYLVEQGFQNVYVCDFAEEPLKNLRTRCPKIKPENLLQIDFFEINGNAWHAELVSASGLKEKEQTLKRVQGDADPTANSVTSSTAKVRGTFERACAKDCAVETPPLTFDLIIEQTFFCAINPSLRKKYFEKMHSLLKPKGKLVGLLFNCDFEVSPPFGGTKTEYENYFRDLFKINVYESCYNSIQAREGRELFINLEK